MSEPAKTGLRHVLGALGALALGYGLLGLMWLLA